MAQTMHKFLDYVESFLNEYGEYIEAACRTYYRW